MKNKIKYGIIKCFTYKVMNKFTKILDEYEEKLAILPVCKLISSIS